MRRYVNGTGIQTGEEFESVEKMVVKEKRSRKKK